MALTATQKARLAEFSKQQEANKASATTTATPTPIPQAPTTTATAPKPSITEQIKQRNTTPVPTQVTDGTQSTVQQPKPTTPTTPTPVVGAPTTTAPTKPVNIKEQIRAQNASVIQAQQIAERTEQEKIMDDVVNYGNALYNQGGDPELAGIRQKESEMVTQAQSFSQSMMDLLNQFSSQDKGTLEDIYNATINSKQFEDQEKELADKKAEIESLDEQISGVEDDVREELKGKASESAIQQRVAQRVRDLSKSRSRLVDDYTQIYDIYSSEKANAMELMKIRAQDQQMKEEKQWKIFETKLGMTKDMFNMQWNILEKGMEREEQAYWKKKDMEDKVTLSKLSLEQQKEYAKRERDNKKTEHKIIQTDTGDIISIDPYTDEYKVLHSASNNYPSVLSDALPTGEVGGQCGYYVNRLLPGMNQEAGLWFGDMLADKTKLINSKMPTIGSAFVMDVGTKNGHVGVVTGINDDGTINVTDSNYKGDQKVSNRTLSKSEMQKVLGYFVPPQKPLTQSDVNLWDSLNELQSSDGKEGAVGFSLEKYTPGRLKPGEGQFMPGSSASAYAAKFNNFKNLLTVPSLAELKKSMPGPLSDSDLKFIKDTATSLSLDMPEAEFDAKLDSIKQKMFANTGLLDLQKKQEQVPDSFQTFAQQQNIGSYFAGITSIFK